MNNKQNCEMERKNCDNFIAAFSSSGLLFFKVIVH